MSEYSSRGERISNRVGRFLGAVVIGLILSVAISGAIWLLVFIWSSIERLLLP